MNFALVVIAHHDLVATFGDFQIFAPDGRDVIDDSRPVESRLHLRHRVAHLGFFCSLANGKVFDIRGYSLAANGKNAHSQHPDQDQPDEGKPPLPRRACTLVHTHIRYSSCWHCCAVLN